MAGGTRPSVRERVKGTGEAGRIVLGWLAGRASWAARAGREVKGVLGQPGLGWV